MMLTKAGITGEERLRRLTPGEPADVPHPGPAGHLLRRRAGLHRVRRRPGRPAGHGGDPDAAVRPGGERLRRGRGRRPGTASTPPRRSTAPSSGSRPCGRPTPPWPTAPRCTATRARAPASSPSAGSTPATASSTSWRSTTRRPRSPRTSRPSAPDMAFRPLLGSAADHPVPSRRPDRGARCPPSASRCGRRTGARPPAAGRRASTRGSPGSGGDYRGRAEISAALSTDAFSQVSFAHRVAGTSAWTPLGTDDNAPYRVFHDVSGLADGTLVEYRVVAEDLRGRVSAASTWGSVGAEGAEQVDGGPTGPVTQPGAVSVPGDHNSEMGCPADWQPDCPQAQLARGADDDIWRASIDVPAGPHAYKVADRQDLGRELRRGRRTERRQHHLHRARRAGALLLRPPHAQHRQLGPGSGRGCGRQLPVRAGVPGRLVAGLPASLAG